MGKHRRHATASSDSVSSKSRSTKSTKRSKKSGTKSKCRKTTGACETQKPKRRNWCVDLDKRYKIMKGAVEDVIEKKMTIRKAAEKWGVKRSTLADRVSGKVGLGRRSGPPAILSRAEEELLTEWILSMAQKGFPFKKQKLLKTVKKILDKDKRTTVLRWNMPGNKWYRQFIKRNPRVKLVTSNPHMDLSEFFPANTELGTVRPIWESASESGTDIESGAESGSETEIEDSESQVESPCPDDTNTNVKISDLEPDVQLESEADDTTCQKDICVEEYPTPDLSVGNTVTITTSDLKETS